MGKKMLVLDIDGTLTNSKKEITPATHTALDAIRAKGHLVVLASGRPMGGMRMLTRELEYDRYGGYIISYNGACVTDTATGEELYKNPLPPDVPGRMLEYARANGLGMFVHQGTDALCGTEMNRYLDLEARVCGFTIRQIDGPEAFRGIDFYKVLMTAEPEIAMEHNARLQAALGDELSVYQSELFFVEVMAKGVDKARAVEGLAARLNIPREDVICCGDGANDLEMIRWAGLGVAMGNARDAVKAAADIVTLTNDEDGLVPVIEKYILGEA